MPNFNPYRIPGYSAGNIPAFGGYGPADVAADRARGEALFPNASNDALGPALAGSSNPNAFSRGGIDSKTAYETRKRAKRIYAPAMAALVAQNALLGPTLDLQRRAGEGYADLYADLAPQYLEGFREADPETSGLLHLLNMDASSLVSRGSSDPFEDRMLQEDIRGSQASRGLGFSRGGAIEELINLDRARDARRIQRGQYGAQIQEAGRQYYSPALLALLGANSSPVSGTATDDLLSLSLNDTAQRRNEQAGRKAGQRALTGQIIGSVLGAAGTAAACWVAEELYGVNDLRTHLARAWVLAHPDDPFVQRYQKHGKRWAKWLKSNRWARLIFQPIWDAMWMKQSGVKPLN